MKDRAGPAEYRLGRVHRIRNHETRELIEYKRPAAIADKAKFPNLGILVSMYNERDNVFVFTAEKVEFTLWKIVMGVRLEYIQDTINIYVLDAEDQVGFATFLEVQPRTAAATSRNQCSQHTCQKRNISAASDEGRVVTLVQPTVNMDACRRSSRTRGVVVAIVE